MADPKTNVSKFPGGSYSVGSVHVGHAWVRAAEAYRDAPSAFSENVQNSIDQGATKIWTTIDKKRRYWHVADNGTGASIDDIDEALGSVYESKKGRGKYGRFGQGFLAPHGCAPRFLFIAAPKSGPYANKYHEWSFVKEDVYPQKDRVLVPRRPRPDIVYDPTVNEEVYRDHKQYVPWHAKVEVFDYEEPKLRGKFGDIDTLWSDLIGNYGDDLRDREIKVSFHMIDEGGISDRKKNLVAERFLGSSLGQMKLEHNDCGAVIFGLYLVRDPKGGRGVGVGEADDKFMVRFKDFTRQVSGMLTDETLRALQSGIFEGTIRAEKIKLVPDRKHFEAGDALDALCLLIEEWFEKQGRKFYDEVKAVRDDERLQRIIDEALEDMADNPFLKDLLELMQGPETASAWKVDPEGQEKTVEPPDSKKKTPKPPRPDPDPKPGPEPGPEPGPVTRKKKTKAYVVTPDGKKRLVTPIPGTRFAAVFIPMPNVPRIYEVRRREGMIYINSLHEYVKACRENERRAAFLTQAIVVEAMSMLKLETLGGDVLAGAQLCAESYGQYMASLIGSSDALRSTGETKKKR